MAKKKLARYREQRKAKTNPKKKEVVEFGANIGAGFAGYAATRFLSRMAYSQAIKRWPDASTHVHVAASALGAAGVYFGSKYWSKVDDYHEAASIGAGIALIQTAIQAYIPKFGWVVADVNAEQYNKGSKKKQQTNRVTASSILPPEVSEAQEALSPASVDDFDLEALLAENPEVEAVQIASSPAAEMSEPDDNIMGEAFGAGGGFGDLDDLENYNGLMN